MSSSWSSLLKFGHGQTLLRSNETLPTNVSCADVAQVFVLEGHPTEPRLFMSAGYDGRVVVWDPTTATQMAA